MFNPTKADRFTFGLWTTGNPGRDPFGEPVRPLLSPIDNVRMLSDLGAYGVNLHDNDLVPFGATAIQRDAIVRDFIKALTDNGMIVPMTTTNLFTHPIFRDGAFTSNDHKVREFALQKAMRAMDLGVELGAEIFVCWGGREGSETDAGKCPVTAIHRYRDAINYLCEYAIAQGYNLRIALEAKPNEPRGHIYLPTTGAMLAFIATLLHHKMVGVNPEFAHELMAGLSFLHAVAQALAVGKLFHIDLNDQDGCRYDQDFRFGSVNPRKAFDLVRLLEDRRYKGPLHFDAHAYRTDSLEGVQHFARGCMRNYLILKDKAARFNADLEIQGILKKIAEADVRTPLPRMNTLKDNVYDIDALAAKGCPYEELDQLTGEILLGVR